jgi:cobalt-zinc-cadmium efflux system outer membrane protein
MNALMTARYEKGALSRRLIFRRLILASWLLLSTPIQAEPHFPSGIINLREAVAAALLRNPGLESFNYAMRIAEAGRIQAGLRPNPDFSAHFENLVGTGELRGTRGLEATLLLSQVLELGDKRARRERAAARALDLRNSAYELQRLDVLAEVARRFVHVVSDQALLEVSREAVAIVERTRDAVEQRVAAARATRAELSRTEIAVARARLELEHREHELRSSRRALAAMWGSIQPRFERAQADLLTLPTISSFKQLRAELRASPDLRYFLTTRRLHEAELQLALAKRVPDARIGAGVRRLEALDDQALVLNFSIGLPLFNQNQGNIEAAQARLDQVASNQRAHFVQAQAVLFATYQELLHAATEAKMLSETVIPEAKRALKAIEAGFNIGRFSYLELTAAQREFIDVRSEAISAAANYHRFVIEIERLTGIGLARLETQEHTP